jgi:A118 family predicted phage portal protein
MTFSQLFVKLKEMMMNMLGVSKTIEQTLHIVPAVSNKMAEAIDEWTRMYKDEADWLHEPTFSDPSKVVSLGLPAFIASEKARMAVLELKSEITAPKRTTVAENPNYFPPTSDAFGNMQVSGHSKTIVVEETIGATERAEFLNEQYQQKLLSRIRTQLEYGIAKGSLIIKPYVVKSKVQNVAGLGADEQVESGAIKYNMEFDFVQADCFYPFAFDSSGKVSEVAFVQTKTDKDKIYTRLEYHKLDGNNVYITNMAFENLNNQTDSNMLHASLGKEIELSAVPEWKNLPPKATVKNVDRLLFGYFKMPDANTIDPHSPLGISGFARAKSLIKEADMQYSRLLWEFEGGELAIDIDRDALQFMQGDDGKGGKQTRQVMSKLQNRLYRSVDLGESDTYKPFSPVLRDASLINGLNTILMKIEDVCALSRGTVSDVAAEARTATELKILRQRSYSSNREIQTALETALRDVIYAMNIYCTLYNIVGDVPRGADGVVDTSKMGQYDVSFTWDDSILVDVETELQKRLTMMNSGLISKRDVRMWYFNESMRQAQDALDEIQEESRLAIEQNMVMSSQLGQSVRNGNDTPKDGDKETAKPVANTETEPKKTNKNNAENMDKTT